MQKQKKYLVRQNRVLLALRHLRVALNANEWRCPMRNDDSTVTATSSAGRHSHTRRLTQLFGHRLHAFALHERFCLQGGSE